MRSYEILKYKLNHYIDFFILYIRCLLYYVQLLYCLLGFYYVNYFILYVTGLLYSLINIKIFKLWNNLHKFGNKMIAIMRRVRLNVPFGNYTLEFSGFIECRPIYAIVKCLLYWLLKIKDIDFEITIANLVSKWSL